MFIKLIAAAAKQKFISALENDIPEKGSFSPVKSGAAIHAKYKISFELSKGISEEKRAITVTVEKPEGIHTENILTGTNPELLGWLRKNGAKKLAEKADEAFYNCSHFYYP